MRPAAALAVLAAAVAAAVHHDAAAKFDQELSHHRGEAAGRHRYSYRYRYQRGSAGAAKGGGVVLAPSRGPSKAAGKPEQQQHHQPQHGTADNHPAHAPRRHTPSAPSAASGDAARRLTAPPPPCQPISPPPDEAATKARFDAFAHAFLVTKNITEAFTYIAEGYINHNPAAQNGAASAWGILSPVWASQRITVLRTTFNGSTGWLDYRSGLGEIVDRFRWDAGCIVEHGEKYPSSS